MNRHLTAVVVASCVAAAMPSWAQQAAPMPGMTMPPTPGGAPAGASMMPAMDRMAKEMAAVPMTGNADRDFAGMMVPHHQGAIDMAQYELAHGKDPAMLKLARDVVAAQAREIRTMKAWLAKYPAG